MGHPVMLSLEQVMQRQRLDRTIRPGPITFESLGDDLGASCDGFQVGFEAGRLPAIRTARVFISRRELDNAFCWGPSFISPLGDRMAGNFPGTLRRKRQAVLEIPG